MEKGRKYVRVTFMGAKDNPSDGTNVFQANLESGRMVVLHKGSPVKMREDEADWLAENNPYYLFEKEVK